MSFKELRNKLETLLAQEEENLKEWRKTVDLAQSVGLTDEASADLGAILRAKQRIEKIKADLVRIPEE